MNEAEKYLATRIRAGQDNAEPLGNAPHQKEDISKGKPWILLGLVLLSGLFGIGAAIIRQLTIGLPDLLAAVLVAPPVEEILKIAIPIMVLEHRANWLGRGRELLWFALGSALIFAVVENLLYTFVYLDNPSPELLQWRWSACTAMHILASGLSGVGLMRAFNRGQRTGEKARFIWEWPWLAGAIVVHMAYNTAAVFLAEPF